MSTSQLFTFVSPFIIECVLVYFISTLTLLPVLSQECKKVATPNISRNVSFTRLHAEKTGPNVNHRPNTVPLHPRLIIPRSEIESCHSSISTPVRSTCRAQKLEPNPALMNPGKPICPRTRSRPVFFLFSYRHCIWKGRAVAFLYALAYHYGRDALIMPARTEKPFVEREKLPRTGYSK